MNEEITRDTILGGGLELEQGEKLLAEFAPDQRAYWRGHAIMAGIGAVLAFAALVITDQPAPWVGPIAALAALGVRGWYLASETLGLRWQVTNRRLIVPGGRAFALGSIAQARPFLGDVQIVTHSGDKHLVKYPADAQAVITAITKAQKTR